MSGSDDSKPVRPDDVDDELLEDFKEETAEHLEAIESLLLKLEQNPQDIQIVHSIFGPMHSIKGSANYLGLTNTGTLAHSLENLLARLRKGEMHAGNAVVDVLLKGIDFIKKLLGEVVSAGWEQSSTEKLVDLVNKILSGETPQELPAAPPGAPPKEAGKAIPAEVVEAPGKAAVPQPQNFQDFFDRYNAGIEDVLKILEKLRQQPTNQEAARNIAGHFREIQSGASFLGLTKIAESGEFVEKTCTGLIERKIKNAGYAIETLGEGIRFLDKLVAEVAESGEEKSDLRPLIGAFARIEFADAVAYDPETEFQEEAAHAIADIGQCLKSLASRGYQIAIYEEIVGAFTNIKGLCFRLGYLQSANLAGAMETMTNILLFGDLEFFPRVQEKFTKAVSLLTSSFARVKRREPEENTAHLVREIQQLIDLRKKILKKKISPKVIKDTEKVVANFLEILAYVEKKGKAKYLEPLKKACADFEHYLIDKDVEYHWNAAQFLLDRIEKLEESQAKLTQENIDSIMGTIQEIQELVLLGKGEALEEERILRENMPVKDRLRYVLGMTASRIKNIAKQYRTTEALQNATVEGLTQIEGITPIMAKRILAEFSVVREALPEEEHLKQEIDQAIAAREGIEDWDCDGELIDIFIDRATHNLHKLTQLLVTWENMEAVPFRTQLKTLLSSLKASANYMGYGAILALADQCLAFLEKLPATQVVSQKELENLRQYFVKIAGSLPVPTQASPAQEAEKIEGVEADISPLAKIAAPSEILDIDMSVLQMDKAPKMTEEPEIPESEEIPEEEAPTTPSSAEESTHEGPPATKGEAMNFPDKMPDGDFGSQEEEEILSLFIDNVEDDIDTLTQTMMALEPHQTDMEPLKKIQEVIKRLEITANQLNFQDLSLLLMKEINNIEEVFQGNPLTDARIEHIRETVANFVDFIRELKGEEIEPELPAGYFEQEDAEARDAMIVTPSKQLTDPEVPAVADLYKTKIPETAPKAPPPPAKVAAPPPPAKVAAPPPPAKVAAPPPPAEEKLLYADVEATQDDLALAHIGDGEEYIHGEEILPDEGPEETLAKVLEEEEEETRAREPVEEVPEPQAAKEEAKAAGETGYFEKFDAVKEDMQAHTLRVNSKKVDELMNLVGELVVNRASFDLLSQDIKTLYRVFLAADVFSKDQARQFKTLIGQMDASSSELGRIANELQSSVMQVRMVPLDVLFKRLPRIVRELSKKIGKMVKLDMYGETTELDKIVIEEITDPLVHIIRNMVDHGIESPEERKKQGKAAYGTVEITAYHEGNQVVIEMADDGKGIDCEIIRRRIVERGVVSEDEAGRMSETELLNMLYRPGFSMADKVTMTSGRGVGMSVIKSNISKIGGTVEIETEVGSYTCFTIKIPLTLAIIQALLVKISGSLYCIPISSVREVVKIKAKDIYTLEGQKVIRLREQVIPLLDPAKIFGLPARSNEPMPFVVIVHSGHKESGLMVNKLLGGQDIVIKSLVDDLVVTPGISGATLMGDGTVSLILDVPSFVSLAYEQESKSTRS